MNKEVWKQIQTHPNYSVSSLGRVKNLLTNKILKPGTSSSKTREGYLMVILDRKKEYIHRLVAEAFIPNSKSKKTINHLNGIKTDNRIGNLEWASYREQMKHAFESKLNKPIAEKQPVKCLNNGLVYESQSIAAKALKIQVSNLNKVLSGQRVHTGGYRFERA